MPYHILHIYIYIYIYSPGLGPERVRSPTFCFCCNICYVCLTTFTISAIIIVYCSDNCCLLFKQWAREGGCQGAPGLNHRSLFHLLGAPFSHSLLCTTICSKKCYFRKNMYPKWCQNPFKMKLQIATLFCFVFL